MLHGWSVSLRRLTGAIHNASLLHRAQSLQVALTCRQTAGAMGKKFYAVKVGRKPGIFHSWDDCRKQVDGYSGAIFKSFPSLKEAESYRGTGCRQIGSEHEQPKPKPKAKVKPEQQQAASPSGIDGALTEEAEVDLCWSEAYRMEFDGASRGNPGQAGAGAVISRDDTGEEVGQVCVGLGRATNNVAEYTALIKGLEAAQSLGVQHLKVAGDSMLVVNQLNGQWKVSNEGLKPLHKRADELKSHFRRFSIRHVFREFNVAADALSNEAIDTGGWDGLRMKGTANHKRKKLTAQAHDAAPSKLLL